VFFSGFPSFSFPGYAARFPTALVPSLNPEECSNRYSFRGLPLVGLVRLSYSNNPLEGFGQHGFHSRSTTWFCCKIGGSKLNQLHHRTRYARAVCKALCSRNLNIIQWFICTLDTCKL